MTSPRWRLVLATTLAGVSCCSFLVARSAERLPARPRPLPFMLPRGLRPADDTIELLAREVDAPPVEGPTPEEDRRALVDPDREFTANHRVVLAALDPDPAQRRCIVISRSSNEQLTLAPGDRIGNEYVLLSIEPTPGVPRGARVKFSDLRRGVVIAITLSPSP